MSAPPIYSGGDYAPGDAVQEHDRSFFHGITGVTVSFSGHFFDYDETAEYATKKGRKFGNIVAAQAYDDTQADEQKGFLIVSNSPNLVDATKRPFPFSAEFYARPWGTRVQTPLVGPPVSVDEYFDLLLFRRPVDTGSNPDETVYSDGYGIRGQREWVLRMGDDYPVVIGIDGDFTLPGWSKTITDTFGNTTTITFT